MYRICHLENIFWLLVFLFCSMQSTYTEVVSHSCNLTGTKAILRFYLSSFYGGVQSSSIAVSGLLLKS